MDVDGSRGLGLSPGSIWWAIFPCSMTRVHTQLACNVPHYRYHTPWNVDTYDTAAPGMSYCLYYDPLPTTAAAVCMQQSQSRKAMDISGSHSSEATAQSVYSSDSSVDDSLEVHSSTCMIALAILYSPIKPFALTVKLSAARISWASKLLRSACK